MSGLVAYDSSSDEDATEAALQVAETPPPRPAENSTKDSILDDAPTSTLSKSDSEALSAQDVNRPVLGPDMSANSDDGQRMIFPRIDESMSERDVIRLQTQAPVPMTSMPPSPPGSPNPEANARFGRFSKLKAEGVHFNEDLVKKTSFLNPDLLATMMTRAGIKADQQYNTALPDDLWNPQGFPSWAYKEELLKSQLDIRDRHNAENKLLSTAGKRVISFTSAGEGSGQSGRRFTPGSQKKRRIP